METQITIVKMQLTLGLSQFCEVLIIRCVCSYVFVMWEVMCAAAEVKSESDGSPEKSQCSVEGMEPPPSSSSSSSSSAASTAGQEGQSLTHTVLDSHLSLCARPERPLPASHSACECINFLCCQVTVAMCSRA